MMLEVLYKDTVTLFNRVTAEREEIWLPHVLTNVHLTMDRAKIVNTFGENSSDNSMLNIRYKGTRTCPMVGDLQFIKPKEFEKLDCGEARNFITFNIGDRFDFYVDGECEELAEFDWMIPEKQFESYGGLFNYMNAHYDNVFAISGFSKYDYIPHFTLTGR